MLPELGVLYREHAAAVWRYTRARLPTDADAEDVTSDVFARAMRSTHTYEATKGTPRAWLTGIARNAVADFWRRQRPEDPVASPPEVDRADDPADASLRHDAIAGVQSALAILSAREREAVALRFGAELSSQEVGAHLGISDTAARMLVHRAVTKLRGVMLDG